MWIKVIIISAILAVVGLLLLRRGSRVLALRRLAMVGFAVAFAASVLFEDVWTVVANAVGVGRGTDLLLYLFIIMTLAFIAATYLHFRGVEMQITALARRVALAEAPPHDPAQPDAG
ncbi:MAG: DUF2304 domain-containing protein [Micrococcales bacterium]|nr:DUF2304 domain-containing protein [Micrococcales bacterium]